jgi:hypothetical protein
VSVQQLESIRDRFLPMARYVQQEYQFRVPLGYPVIHDEPERGVVGIELDPTYSLHFSTDGTSLFADVAFRSSRYDTQSGASREKFAGSQVVDRRPLNPAATDQVLRNLLAELMSRWNGQQALMHFTDS